MSIFLKSGSIINIANENDLETFSELPVATYAVHKNTITNEFFLKIIDDIAIYGKLYGDTEKRTHRIINTFKDRISNTGIMLHGAKGSGKTLLAKNISSELKKLSIPTILISEPFSGQKFNEFIQNINQPVMLLFDEFEKVYDREAQEGILTLLDGTGGGKKLILITCNQRYKLSEFFENRPGRFYYSFEYSGLDENFIREYCEDNLTNKEHIDNIVNMSLNFDHFTFDILQALVEEMNRYKETVSEVLEYINASPASGNCSYEVVDADLKGNLAHLTVDPEVSAGDKINIFKDKFYIYCWNDSENEAPTQSLTRTSNSEYIYLTPDDIVNIRNGKITLKHDDSTFIIKKSSKEEFKFGKYF